MSSKYPKNTSDWSTLPEELLEMILARLDLADHLRFGAVCKSWRSVTARNTAAVKSLGLVRSNEPCRLISRLLSPRLLGSDSSPFAKFIGSYEGWLVVRQTGRRRRVFLLNPALGTTIPLPPLADIIFARKAVLSASPSSGQCIIVLRYFLRYCLRYCLVYWRLGDTATGWTRCYQPRETSRDALDMVFYKDQLYMIALYGGIKVFDSGLNSEPTSIEFPNVCDRVGDNVSNLVNAFDKLLLIETLKSSPYYKVFVLDPRNSSCTHLESIGDDSILLYNPICSLSLLAKDHKDLRPNHLYGHYPYPYPRGTELVSYCFHGKTLTRENTSNLSLLFFTLFKRMGSFITS